MEVRGRRVRGMVREGEAGGGKEECGGMRARECGGSEGMG